MDMDRHDFSKFYIRIIHQRAEMSMEFLMESITFQHLQNFQTKIIFKPYQEI
jgi:hypothetical protein